MLIWLRLTAAEPRPEQPPPSPPSPPTVTPLAPKLAYTLRELSQELGVSKITLYRMEARGFLKSLPYFRHKVFAKEEVERFLTGKGWDPRPVVTTR